MDNKVVVLAASLGGPPLVNDILSGLKANFELPILVLQQMESDFSEPLTHAWSKTTAVNMVRLNESEFMKSGHAYVMPYCAYPEFADKSGRMEIRAHFLNAGEGAGEQWSRAVENCLGQFGSDLILVLLTNPRNMQGRFHLVLEKVKQAGASILVCRESENIAAGNMDTDQIGGWQVMNIDAILSHLQKCAGIIEQTPSKIYSV